MDLIILNHKMNFSTNEIEEYKKRLKKLHTNKKEIVICPSTIYLETMKETNYCIGSQDVSTYENGAHTGDISASQLKDLGVSYCLIGHSERRASYKDENEKTNDKILKLLKYKISPILCIGETLEDKKAKNTKEIITNELNEALENVPLEVIESIIIAYEPIWAIGTGIIPTNEEIDEVAFYIKNYLKHHFSSNLRVIYGGSVNDDNIDTLKNLKEIDGLLLGGISLKLDKLQTVLDKL